MKKLKVNKGTAGKSYLWLWVVLVFVYIFGFGVGYVAHYTVVHWDGFFAKCPDGNKPDKHGCCEGETYTDVGGGWMVCCPESGDNCFPPIK